MRTRILLGAVAACSGVVSTAHAVPITYDFTGSGYVRTYTGVGNNANLALTPFTGTVTIDVNSAGPSGSDSYTDGSTYASDVNGWVNSDFVINWAGSSFAPESAPHLTYEDDFAQVWNKRFGSDRLENRELYSGPNTTVYAQLTRSASDQTWLSDLSFPDVASLAPGSANRITFSDYSWLYNSITTQYDYTGFEGSINLSSLVARPTSVPEPGSLALLSMGLGGIGLARRRRKNARN